VKRHRLTFYEAIKLWLRISFVRVSYYGFNAWNSKGIIKSNQLTLIVFGIWVVLYSCLYAVLQLADDALIMSGMGSLLVLSALMYITRKIDWYSLNNAQDKNFTLRYLMFSISFEHFGLSRDLRWFESLLFSQ
jgi:hypothetical protein